MRRCTRLLMAAIVLSGLLPLYGCPPREVKRVTPPPQYADFSVIAIHDADSDEYNPNCTECHQNRLELTAAEGDLPAFHAVMPELFAPGDARCASCHGGGVDVVFNTTQRLRGDRSCALSACHGPGSAQPFYAANL